MQPIRIRTACVQDAQALLQIYAPYVTDTAITFEYDVPTLPIVQPSARRSIANAIYARRGLPSASRNTSQVAVSEKPTAE